MIQVTFDYDPSRKKGIIISDYLPNIREHFSIEDKNQAFKRRYAVGYRPQTRQYCITPQGRFEPRLLFSILEFLQGQNIQFNIELTDKFRDIIAIPTLKEELVKLNLDPRDYQEESVLAAIKKKSGVIVLPTSAGKTLVIALLVKSIQAQHDCKTLILVPDIQLVAQTYSDFLEYGIPEEEITKWTGSIEPNKNAKIVISNAQILLSEKQDLSLLKDIKLLVIDECIRKNTLITLANNTQKPIQKIKKGDLVRSYNENTKKIEIKPVLNVWKNLQKSNSYNYFLQIHLQDGKVLHVTPNHKIYTQRGYIRADELTLQDELISIKQSYFMNLWYIYMYAKKNYQTYMSNLLKRAKIYRKTS